MIGKSPELKELRAFNFLALCRLLLGSKALPAECAQSAAHQRSADEYPHILEGLTTGEDCRTERPCRVHGSAGEVDAHKVDEDEAETDSKSCEVACADLRIGGAQNYEHEEECGDHLHESCTPYASGVSNTVGAEAAGEIRSTDDGCDCTEQSAGKDTADKLAAPVSACIFPAHAAGESDAKGNGRINVASADAADGVCHGNNRETEGNGCAYHAGRLTTTKKHCRSASKEGENESAYALS